MSDLDIIREQHQPDRPDGFQSCKTCIHFEPYEYDTTPDPWPCDTRRETERADKAEAALAESQGIRDRLANVHAENDARRADADRLAKALRTLCDGAFVTAWEDARAALRQHEEMER